MDNIEAVPVWIALVIFLYWKFRKKVPGHYERYINSAKWRRRSRACRRWARGICKTIDCRMPAHHAHHKSYRHLDSWSPIEMKDLVALCRGCHAGLHRVEGGRLRQAKKINPYIKRDVILRQTTDDWVSGKIKRELVA